LIQLSIEFIHQIVYCIEKLKSGPMSVNKKASGGGRYYILKKN